MSIKLKFTGCIHADSDYYTIYANEGNQFMLVSLDVAYCGRKEILFLQKRGYLGTSVMGHLST